MRLPFSTFFAFSASLFSLFPVYVSAIHPHVLSRHGHRRSPASDVLTSRQHRVPRDILDVCINANVNLLADLSQALAGLLGSLGLGGNVQLCLCLKDLNLYLQTNDQLQALIGILGNKEVSAIITALINTSPSSQQCTFPDHAYHTCNNSDPCHYECDEGYQKDSNGQCVCAPPNITCNNVCGPFPQGCGSAVPRSTKVRRDKIRTLAQAKAVCKAHESVCGIPGRENSLDFECIDTTKSSGSCGGCVVPHPFLEAQPTRQTFGSDCDALPNVERTTCSNSHCVVTACKERWKLTPNNDGCASDRGLSTRKVKLPKRSEPISVNTNATTAIGGNLISQLVAVIDMVLGLPSPASSSPPPPISTSGPSGYAGAIVPLLNDVRNATDVLLKSPTVSDLLFNIDVLLDTLALLNSATQQCQCEDALGLHGLTQKLEELLAAIAHLQEWCAHNPIPTLSTGAPAPTSSQNSTTTAQGGGRDTSSILVGLSDVINHLGLLGPSKAGAAVTGLGPGVNDPVNGLLTGLGIGPPNFKRRDTLLNGNITANATINSAILLQLNDIVNSVTDLHGLLSSVSSTVLSTSDSVLDSSLVVDLDQAVTQLLQATNVPALEASTQAVISAVVNLQDGITTCACFERELLDGVTAYLARLLAAATSVQDLCAHSSTSPPPTSSPAGTTGSVHVAPAPSAHIAPPPAPSSGIPVIVALDRLLAGLGLDDAKADVTVLGLGDGLSSTADNVLNSVNIGPDGLQPRQIAANTSADVDLSLLNDLHASGLIDALLDLVLGLNATHGLLPETSSSAVDPNLVGEIVNATTSLPLESTYAEVVAQTAVVVAKSVLLLNVLESSENVEALGLEALYAYVIKVVDAALALQGWCDAQPASDGPPSTPTQTSLPSPTTALPTSSVPMATRPSAPPPSTVYVYPAGAPTNTHPSAAPAPSTSDEPIIIGLTKTLHDLGLDIDTDVVVDGVLGNSIDHLVNSITNSLGIGPDGARRRFARY
ncbi:hypothetical protein D9619_010385 [Psilocybe cf. subviscida]|uniref:Protein CPL1-like domain-containing protein n=1 Tax=Psilocybe cf. subviscida TaxID=2480587 RepID=A0A8H5ERM6_9AGAR|nr:hypothetical protein D9619_010385 [Psilocybe cf. subviscida]